jgi:NAD(P)-dependent dehydrogenase (short-subunit alcohol dehydrogenase family)
MGELDGRVAFVTGASRGIGAAVAGKLSEAGAKLGLASRSGDDLGLPGALGLECDVTAPAQVDAAVASTVEEHGGLDIVVNNAGVGAYGPYLELPPDQLEEMVDVNLKGTLYATRAALPHLLESDAADLVAVASVAGLRVFPGRRSTAPRSSVRWGSSARSSTSCGIGACAARTSAPAAWPPTSRSAVAAPRTCPSSWA